MLGLMSYLCSGGISLGQSVVFMPLRAMPENKSVTKNQKKNVVQCYWTDPTRKKNRRVNKIDHCPRKKFIQL